MTGQPKTAGVIGGMGPAATVDFMRRVVSATPAATDQDHVRMVVENNPHIPSRQLAMRGEGESPGPVLADSAQRLQQSGADFLVMPCNLAHAWQHDIEAAVTIPFISIIGETVASALDRSDEDSAIGLMTTPGCFSSGLYQHALTRVGRQLVMQSPQQLSETMALVERIKSGDVSSAVTTALLAVASRLRDRGAKVLIAACTEFPIVLKKSMFEIAFISSTDVLARKTVALASGRDDLPE